MANVNTNGGPVDGKQVLRKDTWVGDVQDGPLVVLKAGTKASALTEAQAMQLHPDHFKEA